MLSALDYTEGFQRMSDCVHPKGLVLS